MQHRISPLTLAALALATALPLGAQSDSGGSMVPCAVPMRWSIVDVDGRFGLTQGDARRALTDAASLWERALGAELFEVVGSGGSPITFVYDERQRAVEERRDRRAELDRERAALERRRAEIEQATRAHDTEAASYQREAAEYQRAVQAFNAEVQRWNREGGAPPEEQTKLDRRRQELARTEAELRAFQDRLERSTRALQGDVRELNAWVDRLNGREVEAARDPSIRATESGLYDEVVRQRDGRVESVMRRIRVFRYASDEELVAVLAHELGHALGLGHAREPGAVMSAVIADAATVVAAGRVTERDVRLLATRCPGSVG